MKNIVIATIVLLSGFSAAGIAEESSKPTYGPVLKVKPKGFQQSATTTPARAVTTPSRSTPTAKPATPGSVQTQPRKGLEPDEIDRK